MKCRPKNIDMWKLFGILKFDIIGWDYFVLFPIPPGTNLIRYSYKEFTERFDIIEGD